MIQKDLNLHTKYVCPICFYHGPFGDTLEKQTPLKRYVAICLRCGSKESSRLLRLILTRLNTHLRLHEMTCAHFSAITQEDSHGFFDRYKLYNNDEITADLTDIPEDFPKYDIVMAVHVLEHIRDDHKALANLSNITKKLAILPVPMFNEEPKELDELDGHGHVRDTTSGYYDRYREYFKTISFMSSDNFPDIYQTRILKTDGKVYNEVFPLCSN